MNIQADHIVRLGVKTRIFHLGDYRRASVPHGQDVPGDYFFANGMHAFVYCLLFGGLSLSH